jgi:hypothetical protein
MKKSKYDVKNKLLRKSISYDEKVLVIMHKSVSYYAIP